jgi:arsenate reductase-like glutaredoxin family protein
MVRSAKISRLSEGAVEERPVVHGLRTCDTTRAALKALAGQGAGLRDVREDPLPREVLADWLARLGPGLVNRGSATWRGLGEEERQADPLTLLMRHPALMKRPVVTRGERLTMGWSGPVRIAWLGPG